LADKKGRVSLTTQDLLTLKAELAENMTEASVQVQVKLFDAAVQVMAMPDTPKDSVTTTQSQHLYRLQADDLSMFFEGAPVPPPPDVVGDVVFNVQSHMLEQRPDPESREHTLANTPDNEQA
jgi:hypothetical protein